MEASLTGRYSAYHTQDMLKKYLGGLGSLRRCCGMSERESKTCPAVYQADFKKRGVINCDEVCWRRNRSGVRGIIQV